MASCITGSSAIRFIEKRVGCLSDFAPSLEGRAALAVLPASPIRGSEAGALENGANGNVALLSALFDPADFRCEVHARCNIGRFAHDASPTWEKRPLFPLKMCDIVAEPGGVLLTMPLPDLETHPLDELKPPTDFSPDALRLWISEACQLLKITPTELARAADIAPSTINKFMLSAGSNKSLSGRTMDTVVKAALRMHIDRIGRRQVQAITSRNPAGAAASIVRVGASVKRGAFAESHRWDSEDLFHVSVLTPNKIQRPLLGFLMEDDQAGAALPYGTILVGAKVDPESDVAEAGDWFVVSQKDQAGQTEITVRKLAISPNGDMWLISEEIGPDAYLGKTRADGAAALAQNKSQFTLEYRVLIAIRPMTSDFEGVNFHI